MKSDFEAIVKPVAYVVNSAEYPKTLRVLEKSGIYRFTDDSLSALKIKLQPIGISFERRCATGLVTTMAITLGQWPLREPQTNFLNYAEIKGERENLVEDRVNFTKRYWFWDIFSFRKNRNNAMARQMKADFIKKNFVN